MPYPVIRPTSRNYSAGNWPVKTFNAQNGAEVRMVYGNTRSNVQLQLGYSNISDEDAVKFFQHYDEMQGTFRTFMFSDEARKSMRIGWQGSASPFWLQPGVEWRYEESPRLDSVRPGVSTVTVTLRGVL